MQQRLEETLDSVCADEFLCEISTIEAVCESLLAEAEETSNAILSKRKKRDVDDDEYSYEAFWPKKDLKGWKFWERGSGSKSKRTVRVKRSLELKHEVQEQNKLGYLTELYQNKSNSSAKLLINKASYLELVAGLIMEKFGQEVDIMEFSAFLNGIGKNESFSNFKEFIASFRKAFGDQKADEVLNLVNETATDKENLLNYSDFIDNPILETSEMERDANAQEFNKRDLKIRFKVQGIYSVVSLFLLFTSLYA